MSRSNFSVAEQSEVYTINLKTLKKTFAFSAFFAVYIICKYNQIKLNLQNKFLIVIVILDLEFMGDRFIKVSAQFLIALTYSGNIRKAALAKSSAE